MAQNRINLYIYRKINPFVTNVYFYSNTLELSAITLHFWDFDGEYRSSRWQMFFKIDALKNFAIFIGKHMCWSLFLIQLQASEFFE